MYAIAASLLITVGIYIFIGIYYLGTHRWPSSYSNKRVLFITAHPDDESMFFGPTIRYFTSVTEDINKVFLLCLSNGNYDGLGEARAAELKVAARKLGIPTENVRCVDRADLQDGSQWSPGAVAEEVEKHVKEVNPELIITFDEEGVSGHHNHISVSQGVKKAVVGDHVLVYQLETVPLLRKYSSFLDCFWSSTGTVYSMCSIKDLITVQAAMKCHGTQLTWFRKLYTMFSRYMVVNTLHGVSA